MRVSDLFVYPLKSARRVALAASSIDAFGLAGDRRALVTDPAGRFITQRELPTLARIEARHEPDGGFRLATDGKPDIVVPSPRPDVRMDVEIWKSTVSAALADAASRRALSGWLGREVRLVVFDDRARRTASAEWAGEGTPVAFADGYQVLVTTTGSLDALNADLALHGGEPVGMERFRPNIVIDTPEAWPEDRWAAIEIGGIRLDLVKPCARCIITTQDQATGSRDVPDPMPAMRRLRMSGDRRLPGVLFGWNATPRGSGRIAVGDAVRIVAERPDGWTFRSGP